MEQNSGKAYFVAIATNLVLGYAYVSGKILLESLTSLQILVARFIIATITMYLISYKEKIPIVFKNEIYYFLAAFFGNVLSLWMNFAALKYTTATNVGLFGALVPVITALLGYFILREKKLDRFFWLGCLLAMFGVMLIYLNGEGIKIHIIGDAISFLNSIVASVYILLLGRIGKFSYSVLATSRRITLYSLIIVSGLYLISGHRGDWHQLCDKSVILNLFMLGVGSSGLCLVGYSYATSVLGVGKIGIFSYLCVIASVIYASLILHDKMTWNIVLSTVLIIIGTVLSEHGGKSKNQIFRNTTNIKQKENYL
ncbi:MAG: DMT family transporter [Firmicutes bacterium]|nr:DMT family transporter [Bacillota bacterium]